LYYGSGGNFVEAVERYGQSGATTLWNETKRTIEDIVSLIEKRGIKCGFRHTGAIMVAKSEQEKVRIEKERSALASIGIATGRISGEEIQKSFRGTRFMDGLSFDVTCAIHPAQFVAELAREFNIPTYEKSAMVSFSEATNQVTVRSSKATVTCDRLILATNLEPIYGLDRHFELETTVVLASGEMPNIKQVWPEDKVIWTMEDKYDILYPLGERLALELYEARQIRQKLAQYYNGVKFEIQYRWGESWSKTHDMLPIAGPLTDRVYAAVAMGDEGIVMGFTVGSKMGLAFDGRDDPILKMTAPDRFNR
jgi:glycine/D-amino acid oxidase-like deaminating enzyme